MACLQLHIIISKQKIDPPYCTAVLLRFGYATLIYSVIYYFYSIVRLLPNIDNYTGFTWRMWPSGLFSNIPCCSRPKIIEKHGLFYIRYICYSIEQIII